MKNFLEYISALTLDFRNNIRGATSTQIAGHSPLQVLRVGLKIGHRLGFGLAAWTIGKDRVRKKQQ